MRVFRPVLFAASAVFAFGLAWPAALWFSQGTPPLFWWPYLPFIWPAFMLLILMFLTPRVSPVALQRWSLAGVGLSLLLALTTQAVLLPLLVYVLCATVLNLAIGAHPPNRTYPGKVDQPRVGHPTQ
jgi:hypothetical protein